MATRLAAVAEALPKPSGVMEAVLPKPFKLIRNAVESAETISPKLPKSLQLMPTADVQEAIKTGRPLKGLAPGTYPKDIQRVYDDALERTAKSNSLSEVFGKEHDFIGEHKKIVDAYKEMGFDNERAEQFANNVLTRRHGQIDDMIASRLPGDPKDGSMGKLEAARFALSKEITTNARPMIAVDQYSLKNILRDGRYKTQFEINKSGGVLDNNMRRNVESRLFGYHPDTDPTKRPVYGFLAKGGKIDENTLQEVQPYGNIHLVMKPDVNARTTYTGADSLFPAEIEALPVGTAGARTIPSSIYTLRGDNELIPNLKGYAEAQIHGGVSVNDIDYVTGMVSPKTRKELSELADINVNKHLIGSDEAVALQEELSGRGIRFVPIKPNEVLDANTLDISQAPVVQRPNINANDHLSPV